ncbi:MAG: hypothetical protein HZC04_00240 [Candidatus Lloydbacteria bacterium]|nr:hypothetical protein [Candidatus Lloydbacteria bacterium]
MPTIKDKVLSVCVWLLCVAVIGYSYWLCFLFRNPTEISSAMFALIFCFAAILFVYRSSKDPAEILFVLAMVALLTFVVAPYGDSFLVVVPEKGGVSEARVIKKMGIITHPFSDKFIAIHSKYAVEVDVAINTDDGKKFIAHGHKKEFRVIDPIAVYHRIGATDEAIEGHLRDGIKRCFHSEMSAKQFSDGLVKKTRESFSISSRPCELGLKYYGFEPIGGNQISFADFRMADVFPIRFEIQ